MRKNTPVNNLLRNDEKLTYEVGEQKEKNTEDLLNDLKTMKEKEKLSSWMQEQKKNQKAFGAYFQELCIQYNTTASSLSAKCTPSKGYLYKCMYGERIPSREVIVKLGFALEATKEEIDNMLKYAGHKELYPRNKWDAIIIFGLQNGCTTYEIDELLIENGIEEGLLNEEK